MTILIPDGESNLCLNVMHCLAAVKNTHFIVVAKSNLAYVKYSRYCHEFILDTTSVTERVYIDTLIDIIKSKNVDVIFPIATEAIVTISKFKNELSKYCLLPLLPNAKIATEVNNKAKFAQLMQAGKFNIPNTTNYQPSTKIDYPKLFKPVTGSSGTGIFLAKNKRQLVDKLNPEISYIAQDYIKGYDIDCSYLAKEGKVIAYTIQRRVIDKKDDLNFEPGKNLELVKNQTIKKIISKLAAYLNWNGVAHVDLRYCQKTNKYVLIEINPRYWSSILASKEAGVNFPVLALEKNKTAIEDFKEIRYLSFKDGLLKKLRIKTMDSEKIIPATSSYKYVINDPLPFFIHGARKLLKKLS